MLNGLDGVVALAAAAGEDLAQTSDIVTDNLTAFGLTASDTAHFADVLAAAAANSNTNVSIMGDTFKSSAAVAGALGFTIEDVAVATGLMANAGVKGSRAGTALRNIFNGLLEGATLTGDAIGEVKFSMVNADGTMKSFSETIGELRYWFDQMTEAEKVSNANIVAGMRGYNGLLAILNTTEEEYERLTGVINDCDGAAQKMADTRLDNLAGDVALMESAWEALKDSIGEEFIPVARKAVEAVTDLLTGINGFVQDNPGVVAALASFAGTLLTVATAAGAVKGVIALLGAALGSMLGPVAAIAGGIGLVVGLVTQYIDTVNEGVPSVDDLTDSLQSLEDTMSDSRDTYDGTVEDITANAEVAKLYIGRLEELRAALGDNVAESTEYRNILSLLQDAVPELSDLIDEETGAIQGGTKALSAHVDAWEETAKQEAYQEYLTSYQSAYNDALAEQTANEIKLTETQTKLNQLEERRLELSEQQQKLIDEGGTFAMNSEEYEAAEAELAAIDAEIDTLRRTEGNLVTALDQSNSALETAKAELQDAKNAIADLNGEADNLDTIGLETALQDLADSWETVRKIVEESFESQFGLFDEAKTSTETTVSATMKALKSQETYWHQYNENVTYMQSVTAEQLHVTQDEFDSFFEYVKTQASSGDAEIAGLMSSMVTNLKNGNTEMITDLIKQYAASESERSAAAESTEEWVAGLEDQADELLAYMEDTIDGLDLSDEAREAAEKSMQAYVNGLKSGVGDVVSTVQYIAGIANSALNGNLSLSSYVRGTAYTPGANGTGYSHGSTSYTPGVGLSGYDSGTDNADAGWHMVGENGPELAYFSGGETVLNNNNTERVVQSMRESYSGGGGASFGDVNISLNVPSGVSSVPELESWLRSSGKDAVLDIMRGAARDARRTKL